MGAQQYLWTLLIHVKLKKGLRNLNNNSKQIHESKQTTFSRYFPLSNEQNQVSWQ
jgi:hypothetical protein